MHNSKKNYVIFYKIYILHQADKYVSHTPYIVVFKQRLLYEADHERHFNQNLNIHT